MAPRLTRQRNPVPLAFQVLQQELPQALILDVRGERRVRLGPVPQGSDRQVQERREEPIHMTPIAHRRHVGDEERADPMGISEREGHGDLAPHAVTEQGHPRHALLVEQHQNVLGHLLISHAVGVGGASVVAQIDDQDPVFDGQAPRDGAPVTGRAE